MGPYEMGYSGPGSFHKPPLKILPRFAVELAVSSSLARSPRPGKGIVAKLRKAMGVPQKPRERKNIHM